MRIFYLFLLVLLTVNALPKKQIKKVEEDDEKEDQISGDESSGEKPKTLERIGFQQEAVTNEPAATSTNTKPIAVSPNQSALVQQVVAPQQSAAKLQTQQYKFQQNATTLNTSSTVNMARLPQRNSTNATQYQLSPSYNSTNIQTNVTGAANQSVLFQTLFGAGNGVNASESPLVAKRKAELKCFKTFGESIKGGMAAPELVKIYEDLHECLRGKCNFKKAEISLQESLNEKTLPGQEVFHKYKCYFNWYELIKKACKPERKQDEEESETGEEVMVGKSNKFE